MPERVDNGFRLETRGFLDWLAKFRLRVDTNVAAAGQKPYLRPDHYKVDYTSRRRDRILTIDFTGDKAKTTITDRGKGGPRDEPLDTFADEQLRNVQDPLTGLIEGLLRAKAHLEGKAPAKFTLRGFDGKRRFDIDGEYLGKVQRTITLAGKTKTIKAYRLRLTARTVGGFKKQHRMVWDDTAFDLYLSRDGHFTPLQIISLGHGPVLTLAEICDGPCVLPKAE